MDPDIVPHFSASAKSQGVDSLFGAPGFVLAKQPAFQFSILGRTVSVGIKYDPLVADFLSRIDGQTTVRSICEELAQKHGSDHEKIALHCMKTIMNFIETGVIVFDKQVKS